MRVMMLESWRSWKDEVKLWWGGGDAVYEVPNSRAVCR
jgi:hypothetical protein